MFYIVDPGETSFSAKDEVPNFYRNVSDKTWPRFNAKQSFPRDANKYLFKV